MRASELAERNLAKKVKLSEADIQRQIKEYLQWNGWFVVKIHQSLGSYKGIADLYAIKNGRHVWIEVKKPGGRLSVHQQQFKLDIENHGGTYIVARDIADLKGLREGEQCHESIKTPAGASGGR